MHKEPLAALSRLPTLIHPFSLLNSEFVNLSENPKKLLGPAMV
jgi:hypothetical protein